MCSFGDSCPPQLDVVGRKVLETLNAWKMLHGAEAKAGAGVRTAGTIVRRREVCLLLVVQMRIWKEMTGVSEPLLQVEG